MSEDIDRMMSEITDALSSIADTYVTDADGNFLPTTVITGPHGEIVAKWERGTKTPAEVDALVRQFVELHGLPESARLRDLWAKLDAESGYVR